MIEITMEDVLFLMLIKDILEESLESDEDTGKEKIKQCIDGLDEFIEHLYELKREKENHEA
ncbi:hypothetical protein [Thermodesulfovibrio yellowstonii]|uniref:hypothetical protein n=1 Tax=Thermodesulfovibrio yellowstonii TaxID=28262 RepID=UPI003C7BE50F